MPGHGPEVHLRLPGTGHPSGPSHQPPGQSRAYAAQRKLHIGLFGYSRSVGKVTLPRAIAFTAALYSLELPRRILGLDALRSEDWDLLESAYLNLTQDLGDALRYFNPRSLKLLPEETAKALRDLELISTAEGDPDHQAIVDSILEWGGGDQDGIREAILRAAVIRRFLG